MNCSLVSVTFENTAGWWISTDADATKGTSVDVTDASKNATYLKSDHTDYYWKRD